MSKGLSNYLYVNRATCFRFSKIQTGAVILQSCFLLQLLIVWSIFRSSFISFVSVESHAGIPLISIQKKYDLFWYEEGDHNYSDYLLLLFSSWGISMWSFKYKGLLKLIFLSNLWFKPYNENKLATHTQNKFYRWRAGGKDNSFLITHAQSPCFIRQKWVLDEHNFELSLSILL